MLYYGLRIICLEVAMAKNIDYSSVNLMNKCEYSLSDFIPSKDNPTPECNISDFMVLGPFVLETDGGFETEYLYERHKVLDHDYLADSGGEAASAPYLGKQVKNNYYGPEYLTWKKGYRKWGALRFDNPFESCDEALFVTEQRNCVYYAATYINAAEEMDAVICYINSGCLLYLNGELISNTPYGSVKGLHRIGNRVLVRFKKGRNLLLFKLRVGYIADMIDISMSNCEIYPVVARSGNIIITSPVTSTAYFGTKDAPRQILPLFVGALNDSDKAELTLTSGGYSESHEIEAMKAGSTRLVYTSAPVKTEPYKAEVNIKIQENNAEAAEYTNTYELQPYNGYEGTEHVFTDFHFDTTYHQEQRVYALGAIYITMEILKEIERNPLFTAIISEVDYVHPVFSIYPECREVLRNAFRNGRVEADCFYNQPNELTSNGEALVRNLIYGQLYHRDVLGRIVSVYSPGDVFGHPNQMSQICRKGGCNSARWGKQIIGLDCLFHHVSPDGSDIIHSKGVRMTDAMRLGLTHCDKSTQVKAGFELYPREGDTSWMNKTLNGAKFSLFSDNMNGFIADDERAAKEKGVSKIEYTSRDMTAHHAGVLLTRTDFKQANRLIENLLVTAEKFSAIAAMYGAEYPEKALDKAWRQLLCAQHHDSITGTNNEISFVDLMIQYREAAELAADIVKNASEFIASAIKLGDDSIPVIIFNQHTWDRDEACEFTIPLWAESGYALFDEKGRQLDFEITGKTPCGKKLKAVVIAKVPALGYKAYYLKKTDAIKNAEKSNDTSIENKYYKVTVDPNKGGGIVSIYDKVNKREFIDTSVDGPANRIAVLKELHDRMETQHEFYTTGHKLFSDEFIADVKSEKTAVYEKLIITVKLDIIARVRQEITLYKNSKRIDCKTIVEDYLNQDDLFTVTFPAALNGVKPVYEDRFAPHVTAKSKKKLSFQTHQFFMYSQCQIAPSVNWFDLGPTTQLKFFCTSNNFKGSLNIGPTAIIRPEQTELILAANKLLKTLSKKAIPVTPYPDFEEFRRSKIIHYNEDIPGTDTRFVLSVNGVENRYENELLSRLTQKDAEKFNRYLENKGIAVLYIKDSDNVFNKPIDVILIKAANIEILNTYLDKIKKAYSAGYAAEIKGAVLATKPEPTDDFGMGILNKGTIACSVEGDSLMNMMLFHTAEFYGNIGKTTGHKELIPENKTHVFEYALYPHEKSYREAELFKRGMEFNEPMFAVSEFKTIDKPFLPESKSFLKTDGSFIVTAFKAGGYPLANMHGNIPSIFERGLTIRGFESNGTDSESSFKFGFDIDRVQNTDLLDENASEIVSGKTSFSALIPSHSIETYSISIKEPQQQIEKAKVLGATREIAEPTFIRSYEHDLGSMPMGYYRLVAAISRNVEVIDDKTVRLKISLANNQPDKRETGVLKLVVPESFKADKYEFPYDIEPEGLQCCSVVIKKAEKDSKGVIRLQYEHDGQSFEDIFEFGYFNPEISLKIDGDKIKVTVMNNTDSCLHGELALATPYETWTIGGFNMAARGDVTPYTIPVRLEPNSINNYEFDVKFVNDDILNSWWCVAKLMVNGRIHFAYDAVRSERHNMWTHIFYHEICEDNHSMRKLYEIC
jgi:alpha-mannosidase